MNTFLIIFAVFALFSKAFGATHSPQDAATHAPIKPAPTRSPVTSGPIKPATHSPQEANAVTHEANKPAPTHVAEPATEVPIDHYTKFAPTHAPIEAATHNAEIATRGPIDPYTKPQTLQTVHPTKIYPPFTERPPKYPPITDFPTY